MTKIRNLEKEALSSKPEVRHKGSNDTPASNNKVMISRATGGWLFSGGFTSAP